jgi:hypothetical protein
MEINKTEEVKHIDHVDISYSIDKRYIASTTGNNQTTTLKKRLK